MKNGLKELGGKPVANLETKAYHYLTEFQELTRLSVKYLNERFMSLLLDL